MRRFAWVAAALLLVACDAGAQVTGSTGVVMRSWHTSGGTGREETTVRQAFVPLRASMRIADRADLVLVTGGAASNLDGPAGDASLDGLRSLAARLFMPFAAERALLELGLTAPSGKAKLSPGELRVAQSLGLPLLGFGLRQYGAGPEVAAGATAQVLRTESRRFSLGAATTLRGEFELAEGAGDFRPASEWVLTAAAELGASDDGAPWRVDLAWRSFGADEIDGRTTFEEGDQIESRIEHLRRAGPRLWRGWLRGVLKQENHAPGDGTPLFPDYRASSGDALVLGVSADQPWGERASAGLLLEHSRVSGSDELGRNGWVIGVGPVFGRALGEAAIVDLSFTYALGRLEGVDGGDDSDLSGWALAIGLRTRSAER